MLSPGGATQWGVMLKFDAPSLDSQLFGHGFSARDDEGELQGFWNVVRALWRAKLLIALAARTFAAYGYEASIHDSEDVAAAVWKNVLDHDKRIIRRAT